MADIEGIKKLLDKFKGKKMEGPSVRVGYTAAYAIYVHENLEQRLAGKPRRSGLGVYWGPEGAGPKFLENPARELRPVLSKIVQEVMKKSMSLEKALLAAGLTLQRESQLRVPVEYGILKASAFTRLEGPNDE